MFTQFFYIFLIKPQIFKQIITLGNEISFSTRCDLRNPGRLHEIVIHNTIGNQKCKCLRFPPAPIVWTYLFLIFLGVLLTNFNKTRILTKDAVNPKSQGNQKNSCTTVKIALTNLKRSGFVFIADNLIFFKKKY